MPRLNYLRPSPRSIATPPPELFGGLLFAVVPACDDLAILHGHRTDRDITFRRGDLGFLKGDAHPALMPPQWDVLRAFEGMGACLVFRSRTG